MTKPKTSAQRQTIFRKRLVAAGFKQRMAWVHREDQERYNAFVETLRKPPVDASSGHNK